MPFNSAYCLVYSVPVECPNHDRRFDYRSAEAERRPAWVSLLTTR
jgi:nitrite reductase/ring-hydroxylating ferredoxin subunit